MEGSNPHNHGYWFVLREDQGNVIFSSNNITTIQNPHISQVQEPPRYVVERESRPYTGVEDALPPPAPLAQEDSESNEKPAEKWRKTKEDTFWDKNKLKLLLTLCLEKKNVDKDIPWDDISCIIGATPQQCNIKYQHLRRTYLRLLRKKKMGKDIKWVHYNICEEVFTDLRALPLSVIDPWEDQKIRRLLNLYIEYLPKFRNPGNFLQKDLWKEIGAQLGTTGYHCYHKFKNLKRAYITWLNRNSETGGGIKWAYHQYFERIYDNYNPNTRAWDRHKVKLLLDAYSQIVHKFRNPKLQKKELWNEISRQVGETPDACDKKFRNLKQTFVRLRIKASCGRLTTKWRYYRDFEEIYGSPTRHIDLDYIKHLLEFYLENKDKFKDPLTRNKTLWKKIAPKLGLSPEECDKKFRNLKQTYVRLASKKRQNGKCSKWPYFSYFEKIYDDVDRARSARACGADAGAPARPEPALGAALRELHERREAHRRFERLALLSARGADPVLKKVMLKHVAVSPHRQRADSMSIASSASCCSLGSLDTRHDSVTDLSHRTTTIKVYARCLRPDIEYKTLSVTWGTRAREVVATLLSKFRMRHRDPRLFYLSMEVRVRAAGLRTTLVLDDDARPAALQACHPKGYSKFSLQMRPGGLVKIYDSALMSSSQYKCLLISERTTADELLAILLHCYDSNEGVERFSLYEVSPSQEYERKLHPDDLPLLVQRAWPQDTDCHYRVRRNPRAPPLPPRTIPAPAPAPAETQEEDEPSRALSALSLESDDDNRRYSPVYKFPSISYCRETKNDYLYI